MTTETDYFLAPGAPVADGEPLVFDIDGASVGLANIGGEIFAFDETCTHRACPLSEGEFDGSIITCPCHMSRFDIRTGRVLNGPATEPIRVRTVIRDGDRVLVAR